MKLADFPNLHEANGKPALMTHIVAGYPDLATNEKLICELADCGVRLIEIQIPFSDPLADGAVITKANQQSLSHGTTTTDCLRLMERVSKRVQIPLLFMTYANRVHALGFEQFVKSAADSGCSGFIVPDLPYETADAKHFNAICRQADLPNIQVISSNAESHRVDEILELAQGFVYLTARVGVTGTQNALEQELLDYIAELRTKLRVPLAVGFGISTPAHIQLLAGKAEIAVIGSKLIEIQAQSGTDAVVDFIKSLLA